MVNCRPCRAVLELTVSGRLFHLTCAEARGELAQRIYGTSQRSRLPPELYREILQQLSIAELIPVLATCKNLRFEAMPLYFSRVELVDDHRNLIGRLASFCSYVGPLIKTLVLKNIKRYNHHVKPVLQAVPNIKSLTLLWVSDARGISFGRFIPSKPAFQLRALNLAKQPRSKELIKFIKTHRATLVHLQTALGHTDLNFTFPKLRILGRSLELLKSLAQPSQIKCFELTYHSTTMLFSAPSVRSLSLVASYINLNHLSTIFPNIVFMTIVNVRLIFRISFLSILMHSCRTGRL